ncbi:MAG: RNA chaperone Hfq [Christensenellaceae bacterium]|nr:RNA chaperone Hfq [Christensenellaceae bacterium]
MADVKQINFQDAFLNRVMREGITVNIHVTNGYQIKNAVITGFDNYVIVCNADGHQMMVYKHAISTITLNNKA